MEKINLINVKGINYTLEDINSVGKKTDNGGEIFNDYDNNLANANYSHSEGKDTITNNEAEHAEGKYNVSNTGSSTSAQTIHSVGIGESDSSRKNAIEIMLNGDIYVNGIGGYDGANYSNTVSLQNTISTLTDKVFPSSLSILSTDKVVKIGTTNSFTINWKFTPGIESISISEQYIEYGDSQKQTLEIDDNTFTFNDITQTTDYTITVKDNKGKIYQEKTSIIFVNPSYIGVVSNDFVASQDEIIKLTEIIKNTKEYTTTLSLDYQKICYAYPKSFNDLISIRDNNSYDYIESYDKSTLNINNEDYNIYIYKEPRTINNFKQIYK